jgi:hypothetical protein
LDLGKPTGKAVNGKYATVHSPVLPRLSSSSKLRDTVLLDWGRGNPSPPQLGLVKGNPDILWARFGDHLQPMQSFRGFTLGLAFEFLAELALYQAPMAGIDVFQCLM